MSIVDKENSYAAENTNKLLKLISRHLAKNRKCKGVVYRIAIGVCDRHQDECRRLWLHKDCSNSVFFDCTFKCNRHSSIRKIPVIHHVFIEHMNDIFGGCCNGSQVQYKHGALIPGIYEYRRNENCSGYRHWVKVGE